MADSDTNTGGAGARRSVGLSFALATAMISGVAVFVNGNGVRAFGDPTVYTTFKNTVAAVLLAGVALVVRRRSGTARPIPRDRWPVLALIGLIGGGIPFVLFFEALARASSTDAAFMHKTLLIWVAILAVPLLGERLRAMHVVALGLLLGGQVLLRGDLPAWTFDTPTLMILGATLLWSVEVIVVKRTLPQIDAMTLGVARLGIGAVLLVIWTLATKDVGPLTGSQIGWVLLTGVLLAGYVGTWYSALERAPAVDVMAVLVGASVITALLNRGFKDVPIGPSLGGLALIAAGVAVVIVGIGRTAQQSELQTAQGPAPR